jgi:hypothetical protein
MAASLTSLSEEPIGSCNIYSKQELRSFQQHGLGYGIDVTTDHPWKNRGPFIPRPVTQQSGVKKKVETGALEQYAREVVSGKDINLSAGATLAAIDTSIFKVGLDAEISRSKTYTFHAVGKKIYTHTIAFVTDTGSELTFFEKELRKVTGFDDIEEDGELLQKRCKDFVANNRCTHYVRAIMFGALESEVLTTEEYSRIYSAGGEIGVQQLAAPSLRGRLRRAVRRQVGHGRYVKIGNWNEKNEVEGHPRVIEVEITPVETLVKTAKLQNALINALKEYRAEKLRERPIGPFHIKCRAHDAPLYLLSKTESGRLTTTEDREKASMFSLSMEDSQHPTIFSLHVFADGGPTKYLTAHRYQGGRSPHYDPPLLKESFKDKHIHFSLKDQSLRDGVQVDPQDWVSSEKWYAIRCSHKKFLKKGAKFCMKRESSRDGEFELGAVPSTNSHGVGSYMLFGLESVPVESTEYKYKRTSFTNF